MHMRDARYERAEDERRNDHLDKVQEDVRQQMEIAGDLLGRLGIAGQTQIENDADDEAEHHADRDVDGQLVAHVVPVCTRTLSVLCPA